MYFIWNRWEFIVENECMNIYNDAAEFYTERVKSFLSDSKPKTYEEIFVALRVF